MPSVLAMHPNSSTSSRVSKKSNGLQPNLMRPPIPRRNIISMNNSYPPNTNGHNYHHRNHHHLRGNNNNNNNNNHGQHHQQYGNGHSTQRQQNHQSQPNGNGCNGHRNDYNHRNKKHANHEQYLSKVPPNQSQSNQSQSNHSQSNQSLIISKNKTCDDGQESQGNGQKLTSDPRFLENRSPFYETVSRHCVMPICQKQLINFQFNLPNNFVKDIQNKLKSQKKLNKKNSIKQLNKTINGHNRVLQIRLFDLKQKKHVDWSPELFKLLINNKQVEIPQILTDKNKKKKLGQKAKGFRFVQPLDISKFAKERMDFEIACHKDIFHGAASIEIVNLLTVDQVKYKYMCIYIYIITYNIYRLQTVLKKEAYWHQNCRLFVIRQKH